MILKFQLLSKRKLNLSSCTFLLSSLEPCFLPPRPKTGFLGLGLPHSQFFEHARSAVFDQFLYLPLLIVGSLKMLMSVLLHHKVV